MKFIILAICLVGAVALAQLESEDDLWPIFHIQYSISLCSEGEKDHTRLEDTDCGVYYHCYCRKHGHTCKWAMVTCNAGYVYDKYRTPTPVREREPQFHLCGFNPSHTCARGMPQRSLLREKADHVPEECQGLGETSDFRLWFNLPSEPGNCQIYYACRKSATLHVAKHTCQPGYTTRFTTPQWRDEYDGLCWYGDCTDELETS